MNFFTISICILAVVAGSSASSSVKGFIIIGPAPDYDCAANGAFPHEVNCELFYDCYNDVAFLMSCIDDTLFDLRYDGCELSELVDCGSRIRPNETVTRPSTTTTKRPDVTVTYPPGAPECTPDHHGAYYPHLYYCEQYFECNNYEAVLHFCNYDYLFDLSFNGCNFPELVDCGDRQRPNGTTGRPPQTTPESGYQCDPDKNGAFPHDTYCEKYWDCYNGVATLLQCAAGRLFEPKWGSCELADTVDCGDRIRPNGTNPTTTTPRTTTTRLPVTGDPEEFVCPQPDGLFADPSDCSTYYQCSHGHPNKMTCPRPLLYHAENTICDFPDKVDCGTRPIPTHVD